MRINFVATLLAGMVLSFYSSTVRAADLPAVIRSVKAGDWSAAQTWEGGKAPSAGARVLIRPGHRVVYDIKSDVTFRAVFVGGTLTFARDRDTQMNVGLLRVQPGEDATESGFDCTMKHGGDNPPANDVSFGQATLEIGSADAPIPAEHKALIRLAAIEGMEKESFPALVCCGGRMEIHGAPLSRTWVKLGGPAKVGDSAIALLEPVTGWRAGDKLILTATVRQSKKEKTFKNSTRDSTQTEERTIASIAPDGLKITLDQPLTYAHSADGEYRADVANLSRNVIIESADPEKARGHTMYHRASTGSISYAEFRHLGKEGVLGRYNLHFHLCGDSMRGASVIGASFWDSGNRWLTIHGTNYLVVRDCVGYQSMGHGFFLEDGTEVYNVLDRNLAVQAYTAKKLPDQALPFDQNDGSGFWWANSLNTFTRNVAAECDEYGYFFQAIESPQFKLVMNVRQPDGSKKAVDIRTLPFVRFEDNEANCQRRHGFNLGGSVPFGLGVNGIGPDVQHPFVLKNFRVWNSHWSIHPVSPGVMLDGLDVHVCEYGVWRPVYKAHAYRNVHLEQISVSPEFSPTGQKPVEAEYPKPLNPVDDLPPTTVITYAGISGGKLIVRGTTADNGDVKRVTINGAEAKATRDNFAEWEVSLAAPAGAIKLTAQSEDSAGNVEKTPHEMMHGVGK